MIPNSTKLSTLPSRLTNFLFYTSNHYNSNPQFDMFFLSTISQHGNLCLLVPEKETEEPLKAIA